MIKQNSLRFIFLSSRVLIPRRLLRLVIARLCEAIYRREIASSKSILFMESGGFRSGKGTILQEEIHIGKNFFNVIEGHR